MYAAATVDGDDENPLEKRSLKMKRERKSYRLQITFATKMVSASFTYK